MFASRSAAARMTAVAFTPRVLPARPVRTLAEYEQAGGGRGVEAAVRLGPAGVIEEGAASGLRGRGGAGVPTGRKWGAGAAYAPPVEPTTILVDGAEGEPRALQEHALP